MENFKLDYYDFAQNSMWLEKVNDSWDAYKHILYEKGMYRELNFHIEPIADNDVQKVLENYFNVVKDFPGRSKKAT